MTEPSSSAEALSQGKTNGGCTRVLLANGLDERWCRVGYRVDGGPGDRVGGCQVSALRATSGNPKLAFSFFPTNRFRAGIPINR